MKKVREFINESEQALKQLSNTRKDKSDLVQMHTSLKDLENKLKKESDGKEKQELLKEIDNLLFVVSSMLDYYSEEMGER